MAFSFRQRIGLGGGIRIGCKDPELILADGPDEIVKLVGDHPLGAAQSSIDDSGTLSLYGHGYEFVEQASKAGTEWTGHIQGAFARLHLGADFGRRTPQMSHFTTYGLSALFPWMGGRVLNDVAGLLVFESEPRPKGFVSMSVGVVKPPRPAADRVRAAVAYARSQGYDPSSTENLAFDLYGASFFEHSPDAKYMMLMMAVETLATQNARTAAGQEHVDRLIEATRASGLGSDDIASMVGSLGHLKHEFVIGACKRLTLERLGDRIYGGNPAVDYFSDAYELRSKLAHGDEDRPTHNQIDGQLIELKRFVGDLLSGPLLSFES